MLQEVVLLADLEVKVVLWAPPGVLDVFLVPSVLLTL